MAKLDWEKQNRSELVGKRLQQYFDEKTADPSNYETLLKDCGFPPSLEATEVMNTSQAEWRRAAKELHLTVDRKSELRRDQKQELKAFVNNQLKDIYAQILVLRLLALYPSKLGIE